MSQLCIELASLSSKHFKKSLEPTVIQAETSPMAGVVGEEASFSALLQDLASMLQCDASSSQALPVLQAISAAIQKLLPRLPPAFLEPILPGDCLDDQQVLTKVL